jgi:hypothetical protein
LLSRRILWVQLKFFHFLLGLSSCRRDSVAVLELKQALKELIDIMQGQLLVNVNIPVLVNGYGVFIDLLVNVIDDGSSVDHDLETETFSVIFFKA